MQRYKLTIEYDGSPYCGWQRQVDLPSVQQELEKILTLLNEAEEPVTVFGAGRTDTGVHATGQVAHATLNRDWTGRKLMTAMNARLRQSDQLISVLAAETVPMEFDARFSARQRHYLYRVINRPAQPALDKLRAWHIKSPLNLTAMREAGDALLGHHDFTSFRATACQAKSPWRTLERLEILTSGEEVHIHVSALSFLHSQVRSIVGSLIEVGLNRWPAAQMQRALEATDRTACGPVAPPFGLYLVQVDY